MDGPRNPHDILAVLGEKELQGYLVNEVQEVYRLRASASTTSTSFMARGIAPRGDARQMMR